MHIVKTTQLFKGIFTNEDGLKECEELLRFEKVIFTNSNGEEKLVHRMFYYRNGEEFGCKLFDNADAGNNYFLWCVNHGYKSTIEHRIYRDCNGFYQEQIRIHPMQRWDEYANDGWRSTRYLSWDEVRNSKYAVVEYNAQ